jgi:hypothetical protein
VVGVAGAAMVVASLVGCSSNKSNPELIEFDLTGGGWPPGHRRRSEPERHWSGWLHRER